MNIQAALVQRRATILLRMFSEFQQCCFECVRNCGIVQLSRTQRGDSLGECPVRWKQRWDTHKRRFQNIKSFGFSIFRGYTQPVKRSQKRKLCFTCGRTSRPGDPVIVRLLQRLQTLFKRLVMLFRQKATDDKMQIGSLREDSLRSLQKSEGAFLRTDPSKVAHRESCRTLIRLLMHDRVGRTCRGGQLNCERYVVKLIGRQVQVGVHEAGVVTAVSQQTIKVRCVFTDKRNRS